MIINSCLTCKFHEFREEEGEKMSRCVKENCYSEFSKCIAMKALKQFLQDESPKEKVTSLPRDGFVLAKEGLQASKD